MAVPEPAALPAPPPPKFVLRLEEPRLPPVVPDDPSVCAEAPAAKIEAAKPAQKHFLNDFIANSANIGAIYTLIGNYRMILPDGTSRKDEKAISRTVFGNRRVLPAIVRIRLVPSLGFTPIECSIS